MTISCITATVARVEQSGTFLLSRAFSEAFSEAFSFPLFLTLFYSFSPFLTLSHPFSLSLTFSCSFSPFLALSRPFLLFLTFLALSHFSFFSFSFKLEHTPPLPGLSPLWHVTSCHHSPLSAFVLVSWPCLFFPLLLCFFLLLLLLVLFLLLHLLIAHPPTQRCVYVHWVWPPDCFDAVTSPTCDGCEWSECFWAVVFCVCVWFWVL